MIKKLRRKWQIQRAKWILKSRKIKLANVIYWYFIFSGIGMFLYGISCIFTGFPLIYMGSPIGILVAIFILIGIRKNWRLMWLFGSSMKRGRLFFAINKIFQETSVTEIQKVKLVKWVYLPRGYIRNERWLELGEKIRTGKELTRVEKKEYKKKVISCPQQFLDGINRSFLVHNLIYAHVQIEKLDPEFRDIMELTDENMLKFDLQEEANKCKIEEEREKINKYIEIGKRASAMKGKRKK